MSAADTDRWPGIAGSIAVVTGAASGQGRAVAAMLAENGARVNLVDTAPGVVDVAAEISSSARGIIADVADPGTWSDIAATLSKEHGRLDLLVNNAGIYRRSRIEDQPVEELDHLYRVNQRAPLLACRALLELMRASPHAAIVNVSSTAGLVGDPEIVAYSMTKWAVRGLTRSLATEVAPHGIRVNTIVPGLFSTAMAEANGDAVNEAIVGRSLLKRIGAPNEIAPAVLFLLSGLSSYITGTELVVDGGLTT